MGEPKDIYGVKHLAADSQYPLQHLFLEFNQGKVDQSQIGNYIQLAFNLLDSAADSIFLHDIDGHIIFANRIAYESRGYSKEEMLSINIHRLYPQDYATTRDTFLDDLKEKGQVTFEAEHLCRDGSVIPVETRMRYTMLGKIPLVLTVARDITGRKQTEDRLKRYSGFLENVVNERTSNLVQANELLKKQLVELQRAGEELSRSEEKFRLLFDGSAEGIVYLSKEGVILDINSQIINRLHVSKQDLVGQKLLDILPLIGLDADNVRSSLDKLASNGTEVEKFEWCMKSSSGDIGTLEVIPAVIKEQDNIIGFALFIEDVTERRRIEAELIRTEKLESVGVLAGGIAHDFNNFLTAILGNITLARQDLNPDDAGYRRLTDAENALLKARELTSQLLTFSKGGMPIKKSTSISALLMDTARFALRGSNVECEFSIPDNLWQAEADGGQISRVIHNLVLNGQQAMPGGGICRISCENVSVKGQQGISLRDGDYIKICVKDNGMGIPEDKIHKIFDPYFTTKEKGSGLGLTTAYYIIKNHGGVISVDSEPGEGTICSIYLPASASSKENVRVYAEEVHCNTARILVMDDMEIVRKVTGEMLRKIGYTNVEFACDGGEAIQLYREALDKGKPHDVVLMDLTVPGGMGGKEAIITMLDINPTVKVIASSGYSNDVIISKFREFGFCGFIGKPFTLTDLKLALESVLGSN